ncbi:MAG: hypothetical protein HQL51_04985 [Magnetococcales bacterium]|nr:hypothetical protein [Magnetococcales bacterium]
MIAIEMEAPIINHRLEISSDRLPAHVTRARVLVYYEEPEPWNVEDTPPSPAAEGTAPPGEVARALVPYRFQLDAPPFDREELHDR